MIETLKNQTLPTGSGIFFDTFMLELSGLLIESQVTDYRMETVISCIRRIFYGSLDLTYGASFDLLIPGTANLICPEIFSNDPNSQASVEYLQANPQGLIYDTPIDLGHLFAVLEAGFYPASVSLLDGAIRLRSNREAVSYVGDLGSVVLNYIASFTGDFEQLAREKDQLHLVQMFNLFAGKADMAANADAHIMPIHPEKSLMENLIQYYGNPDSGQEARYTGFALAIGLGELEGEVFSGEDRNWRDSIRSEIFNSALAIGLNEGREEEVMLALENPGMGLPFGAPTFWEAFWNISDWVLDYFIDWMRFQVKLEMM